MNIIDFATVQGLHQERTKLLDKLAVLEAKGFDLTTHFNVHFHGTAQSPEIAEIAAQPLRAHYRRLLAETDAKLTGLGVRVDQHDRLAELRPENFVPPPGAPAATGILSTEEAGDGPEVLSAVMSLVKKTIDTAGLGRTWEAKDLTTLHEGKTIPLGSYKVTVQKTG